MSTTDGEHYDNQPDDQPDTRRGERKHVFAVNHDPEFLDVVRVLLQDGHYNVTTTNYVPRPWAQIAALQPSPLLIDLVPHSQAAWELLERLHGQAVTSRIPVVVTSTLPSLLERVRADHGRYGGDKLVTKSLDIDELLETIGALIGPA